MLLKPLCISRSYKVYETSINPYTNDTHKTTPFHITLLRSQKEDYQVYGLDKTWFKPTKTDKTKQFLKKLEYMYASTVKAA